MRRLLVLLIALVLLAGCGGGGGSGSGSPAQTGSTQVNEANVMREEHAPPGPAKRDKREDPIPTIPSQQP